MEGRGRRGETKVTYEEWGDAFNGFGGDAGQKLYDMMYEDWTADRAALVTLSNEHAKSYADAQSRFLKAEADREALLRENETLEETWRRNHRRQWQRAERERRHREWALKQARLQHHRCINQTEARVAKARAWAAEQRAQAAEDDRRIAEYERKKLLLQLQAAEARVKRLEALMAEATEGFDEYWLTQSQDFKHRWDAALSPRAPQLSVEASDVVPPGEVWLVGVNKEGTGPEIKSKIINVDPQAPQEVNRE